MCIFPCFIIVLLVFSRCNNSEYFIPLFYSNHRLIWAIAIGWLIISCHYNFAAFINKFLSMKIWKPIEKIGLSLYLTHSAVISYVVLSKKKPIEFGGITMVSFSTFLPFNLICTKIFALVQL